MKRFTLVVLLLLLLPFVGHGAAPPHSANLTWTWSQGTGDPATGFHIQRSTVSGGPYTLIGTVSITASFAFTDTNVVAGQTYFYVVTAFNPGGDSALSNQVTGTVPFSVPAAPATLSITVN